MDGKTDIIREIEKELTRREILNKSIAHRVSEAKKEIVSALKTVEGKNDQAGRT